MPSSAADTKKRPPRDRALLESIAGPLEPERFPFYVLASDSGEPDGWYWIPKETGHPVFLGRNVHYAQDRLLRIVRE